MVVDEGSQLADDFVRPALREPGFQAVLEDVQSALHQSVALRTCELERVELCKFASGFCFGTHRDLAVDVHRRGNGRARRALGAPLTYL